MTIAPAARIADAIDGDAALVRRATDALDALTDDELCEVRCRMAVYAKSFSGPDWERWLKMAISFDAAARDAQRKKRESK